MHLQEVMTALAEMGQPATKTMLMKNHGVREPCFGVKIGDMKRIVKQVKVDHTLALQLYDTGNYDAMYLAGLIADDARMTQRDLQKWANAAYGASLPGYTVAWVASGSPHGWKMALKWIDSKKPHVAVAGWSTLACLAGSKPDEALDLPTLRKLIQHIEGSIHEAPDIVRYWMNGFLIALGCGVSELTNEVLAAAKRIGPVQASLGKNQCKVPDIEGYIQKVADRGGIGRKRKNVKC